MTEPGIIRLRGVKTHNLHDIDVDIPGRRMTVITGVSGSGKSSLAFDTLFAESQLRFLESLSPYIRQFMDKFRKPPLDEADGLLPAMAIQQRRTVKNSRSTVGTLTEIMDYLRLLFVRGGDRFCPHCGEPVVQYSPAAVAEWCVDHLAGRPVTILFSLRVIGTAGKDRRLMELLQRMGFVRVFSDGAIQRLEDVTALSREDDVVVDRTTVDPADRDRLLEALRRAYEEGNEECVLLVPAGEAPAQWPANVEARTINGFVRTVWAGHSICLACGAELPHLTESLLSFNTPEGACPECRGFGEQAFYDPTRYLDSSRTLADNPVLAWTGPRYRMFHRRLLSWARERDVPEDVPFGLLPDDIRAAVQHGGMGFHGVDAFFHRLDKKKYKMHIRVFLSRFRSFARCGHCAGKRLNADALSVRVAGRDIGDVLGMSVTEARRFVRTLNLSTDRLAGMGRVIDDLETRLACLDMLGVGYLGLDRMSFTLSGGESQRVHLAAIVGIRLADTLYVLDEPTMGLHPRDNDRLAAVLTDLCRQGNTVVCVEHDPDFIRHADHVVDLGPGAGDRGGRVVYQGAMADFLRESDSPTARYLHGAGRTRIRPPADGRPGRSMLEIRGARARNLRAIHPRFPLGCLTCVTGVSGSGKSTLLEEVLVPALEARLSSGNPPAVLDELRGGDDLGFYRLVDQGLPPAGSRSNPLTWLDLFTPVRELFAAGEDAVLNGLGPGYFSPNVAGGRCETCKGKGRAVLEMQSLADEEVLCEDCQGTGYTREARRYTFQGLNIVDTLELTVEQARDHFGDHRRLEKGLTMLAEVGLGYLRLGQTMDTMSGGEIQRLKLCRALTDRGPGQGLFLLDEPTTGLHPADTAQLLMLLDRLLEQGHTVVAVEHDLFFLSNADWVIDLGPEGGQGGGRLLYQGDVDGLTACSLSHTGVALDRWHRGIERTDRS